MKVTCSLCKRKTQDYDLESVPGMYNSVCLSCVQEIEDAVQDTINDIRARSKFTKGKKAKSVPEKIVEIDGKKYAVQTGGMK